MSFATHPTARVCLHLLWLLAMPCLGMAQSWSGITTSSQQGSLGWTFCLATALDRTGNTVVVGNFTGTITLGPTTLTSEGDRDIFVARLSPAGVWVQAARAGGAGKDLALAVAIDAANNAVVAGSFAGSPASGATVNFGAIKLTSAGGSDAFVARLSPTGAWTQAVRAGGAADDEATSLALDATGTACIGGYFISSTANFGATTLTNASTSLTSDAFVARLTPAGIWSQAVRLGGTDSDAISSLVLDDAGAAIITGGFRSATLSLGSTALTNVDPINGTYDVFIAQLSAAGTWTQALRAGGAGNDYAQAIARTSAGQLIVAGIFSSATALFGPFSLANANPSSLYNYDVFVARLDPNATWTQAARAGGTGSDAAEALVVDGTGNAIVAGKFSMTASFGSLSLKSAGSTDVFVAMLGTTGNWLQATQAGGDAEDAASSLSWDGSTLMVGGYLTSFTSLFGSTIVAVGRPTGFVGRLMGLPLADKPSGMAPIFTLGPNPATGSTTLAFTADATTRSAHLLDALGREARRFMLPAHITSLPLDLIGLPSGLYLLRCGPITGRLVVE